MEMPHLDAPVATRRTLADVIAAQAGTPLPTDDVLHLMLLLMRAVAALHAEGRVAALGLGDVVEAADGRLSLARPHGLEPAVDMAAIRRVQPQATDGFLDDEEVAVMDGVEAAAEQADAHHDAPSVAAGGAAPAQSRGRRKSL